MVSRDTEHNPSSRHADSVDTETETSGLEAREDSRHLQRIIDAIPAPIFFKNADFLYAGCNQAFGRLILGDTPESIEGKGVYDLAPAELAAVYEKADRELFEDGGTQRYETQVRYQDGVLHDIEFHKAVIYDAAGNKLGLVGTMLDTTERRRREAEAERLANFDTLTGLPNRRGLQERAELALLWAMKSNRPLGLFFLDLDRFKDINDTQGHEAGDQLLEQVAGRLGAALRDRDILTRLGGDEFAILLPDTGRNELAKIARRLLARFESPFHISSQSLRVWPSIGVVVCPDDGATLGELLKHADIAMYRAKNEHSGYTMFDTAHVDEVHERVGLEQRLRHAIEAGDICLAYQPRVWVREGRVVSLEALARWHDPERGRVQPSQFIPLAEATGLIHRLGRQVLTLACRQTAAWRSAGLHVRVAVNVSARELQDAGFVDGFMDTLAENDLPGEALELELTETALMSSPEDSILALGRLRAAGVRIAVDDFGAGYSSLNYLKRLPVDTLKVDQGFVADIVTDPIDVGIVEAIVALARSLGVGVIAEGVEREDQEQALLRLGCEVQQGKRVRRPVPAQDIEGWLRQRQG